MTKGRKVNGLLGTAAACKQAKVTRQALWQWIVAGVRGEDGERRRLKAVQKYGRWMVDPADLAAWMREVGR